MTLAGCAAHRIERADYGIEPCSPAMARELLEPMALHCWWQAAHGRWRTLSHESHYTSLVVDVEVSDLRDTLEIARRFVTAESSTYSEILLYGHPDAASRSRTVRRIKWSMQSGFQTLDFELPDT